jgi:hypothetical protein
MRSFFRARRATEQMRDQHLLRVLVQKRRIERSRHNSVTSFKKSFHQTKTTEFKATHKKLLSSLKKSQPKAPRPQPSDIWIPILKNLINDHFPITQFLPNHLPTVLTSYSLPCLKDRSRGSGGWHIRENV